jgi:hypothetical protein
MQNYTIIKQTTTSMIIEMEAQKLSVEDQKRIFGKNLKHAAIDETLKFILQEDFIFDIDTLIYHDLDPGFRLLQKGTYPLEMNQGKIMIFMTLSPYR